MVTRLAVIGLRVLVWIALAAATLRALGGAVGIWAGGSLTAFATLLVGVAAPAWFFVFFPSWLAWRILRPLRLRPLVKAAFWLSPLSRARDLRSVGVFLEVAAGRPLPAPEEVGADGWTALALALQADRQGSFARADRIVEALRHLPAGCRFPFLARVYGVEALVASALARDDWPRARCYAELGRGRLAALVARIGEDGASRPAPRARLWLRWLLAPLRPLTARALRRLHPRATAPASVIAPPGRTLRPDNPAEGAAAAANVRLRHVRLLGRAAQGEPVTLGEVLALAAAWQGELDEAALAEIRARALELGARNGAERARALREAVLEELVELGARAEGEAPRSPAAGPLADELAGRIRDRLLRRVEAALVPLDPGRSEPPRNALEAWERFLALQAALENVEQRVGASALTASWYGGLRDTVWSASCALFNDRRTGSAWVAHMMFTWVADRAEILGDLPATLLNRENARSARDAA